MKLKQLILPLLFVAAGVTTVVGCYGNVDLKEPSTFKCDSNSDCLDDFECKNGFCEVKPPVDTSNPCIDKDGDGYGGPENTPAQILNCTQCKQSRLPKTADNPDCQVDCRDDDKSINPGATEICDGIDNDCRDGVDSTMHCRGPGACGPTPTSSDPFDKTMCDSDPYKQVDGTAICHLYKEESDGTCQYYICKNGAYAEEEGGPRACP